MSAAALKQTRLEYFERNGAFIGAHTTNEAVIQ
jgi:hypothetical protein